MGRYLYVYEYDHAAFGTHREFSPRTWNGVRPARTVALYAAPQHHAHADALCNCRACIDERDDRIGGLPRWACEMIVCAICGNKRCPHATDHRHACTGSNEPGQPGSLCEHVKPIKVALPAQADARETQDHVGRLRTVAEAIRYSDRFTGTQQGRDLADFYARTIESATDALSTRAAGLTDEQREAIEWAAGRAYSEAKTVKGESLIQKRWRVLSDLLASHQGQPEPRAEVTR